MATSDWVLIITTLFLGVIAIWSDTIRSLVAGPRLALVPHNFRGAVVPISNSAARAIFYHLQLK
jgi:hypothetical protein